MPLNLIDPKPDHTKAHELFWFPNQKDIIGSLFFDQITQVSIDGGSPIYLCTVSEAKKLDEKGNAWEIHGEAKLRFHTRAVWKKYRAQFIISRKFGWIEFLT